MRRLTILCMIASACSDRAVGGGGEGSSEGGATSSASVGSASVGSASTSATTSTTGSTSSSSDTLMTGNDSDPTLDDSGPGCDLPNCGVPCDPWEQDCPEGEKCMPWANDGGNEWNDYKCTPLDPDPKQPGEPCTVEGNGVSGIDDCDVAAMCWDVDPDTNMGTCVAFCQGDEANPTCAEACHDCAISGAGVLILCLPVCDPLASDCPEGRGCYPLPSGGFGCAPDVSARGGGLGDACEFVNSCDAGLFCTEAVNVPSCEIDAPGCCASFCDVTAADPCPGADPGFECVPWWEPGEQPMDGCIAGVLGACVLPP